MMRLSARQLVEDIDEDDRRLARMEQKGVEIDEDHQRFIDESRAQQEIINVNYRKFIQEGDIERMNEFLLVVEFN